MSGKSKRTVSLERGTVDISREDKRKSVFERLGGNSSSRNYEQDEVSALISNIFFYMLC